MRTSEPSTVAFFAPCQEKAIAGLFAQGDPGTDGGAHPEPDAARASRKAICEIVVAQTIPRTLRLNAPPVWLEALRRKAVGGDHGQHHCGRDRLVVR